MSDLRGQIDVALLPVWGWGPSAGQGHLDPERAARAAAMISPPVAIPIHWGTLALPWLRRRRASDPAEPARRFAALTAVSAPDVEVRLLEVGGRSSLA
jgi:L-ascorbate metabolism protein UlaG (beta-lactamase superfamily)